MRKNSAKGGWLVEKEEDPVGQETPAPPLLLACSYCFDAAARRKKKINHQAPKLDFFFQELSYSPLRLDSVISERDARKSIS